MIEDGKTIENPIRRLILELSRNCNIACRMCGFGGNKIRSDWFMEEKLFNKILNQRDTLQELNEIRLNGRGESTIHPKFLSLLSKIREIFPHVTLTMFTNLMFKDNEILDRIIESNVLLFISVDSSNKEKFEYIRRGASFDRLIERLDSVPDGFIVFTLQENNIEEIVEIANLAKMYSLGLIFNNIHLQDEHLQFKFRSLVEENQNKILQDFTVVRDMFPPEKVLIPDQILGFAIPEEISTSTSCGRLESCPNAHSEIMISYDGLIFPCNMFHPEILGDGISQELDQIWISSMRHKFIANHKKSSYCQNCAYLFPEGGKKNNYFC